MAAGVIAEDCEVFHLDTELQRFVGADRRRRDPRGMDRVQRLFVEQNFEAWVLVAPFSDEMRLVGVLAQFSVGSVDIISTSSLLADARSCVHATVPRGFWKVIPDPEDVVLAPFALGNLDIFYAPFVSGSHSHPMRQSWRQLEVKMDSDPVEEVALLARCLVRRLVQVPASVYGGI